MRTTTMAITPVLNPAEQQAAAAASAMPTRGEVLARRIRVWGVRSVLSVVDQGLTAAVGFGVNVLLARWLAPDAYGAYAVAFAGFLFVSGFHNVLLLEPLTVIGPSQHATRLARYFREQLVIHAILVGALALVILASGLLIAKWQPHNPLVPALLGGAIAVPFLLLLWLVRRMCYVLQRPSVAVFGSAFYLGFVTAGLYLLKYQGWVSPFTALVLMGLGSLLASCVLLWRLYAVLARAAHDHKRLPWLVILKENWNYGRWLVGSALLAPLATQTQMFLIAAYLGLSAAGILRAMQIPSLVMIQVLAATGLLVLPSFSYDFGRGSISRMRHKATIITIALTAATLLAAVLLAAFAAPLDHLLFLGKYAANASLMPILALVPVALSASIGYSMALRASQKPRFDLIANAIAAPVSVLSALLFMHWWGLIGAAASMAMTYMCYSAATIWVYYANPHFSDIRSPAA